MSDLPFVSVVMPVYNEKRYIAQAIQSLVMQDYPKDRMEAVLVDGMSTDGTVDCIRQAMEDYPFIRLIDNPDRTVQFALNRGIKAARGEYIVRFDAHTKYAPDYISKCMEYHKKTGADNVGGPTIVRGNTPCQKAVAAAYYSPFALGGGKQHIEGFDGYADTVSYGSFQKETALKLGLFDERLAINEDDDFNFRLCEAGGKVYISHEICSTYYPRDSYRSLFRQYFRYGFWKVAVIKKHKKPARLSHLIPCLFVLFLVLGLVLSLVFPPLWYAYGAVLVLYLALDFAFSVKNRHIKGFLNVLRLMYIHFILHLSYGTGFICGIFRFLFYHF